MVDPKLRARARLLAEIKREVTDQCIVVVDDPKRRSNLTPAEEIDTLRASGHITAATTVVWLRDCPYLPSAAAQQNWLKTEGQPIALNL